MLVTEHIIIDFDGDLTFLCNSIAFYCLYRQLHRNYFKWEKGYSLIKHLIQNSPRQMAYICRNKIKRSHKPWTKHFIKLLSKFFLSILYCRSFIDILNRTLKNRSYFWFALRVLHFTAFFFYWTINPIFFCSQNSISNYELMWSMSGSDFKPAIRFIGYSFIYFPCPKRI